MKISRGAIWFQERAGLVETRRGPLTAAAPTLNLVNTAYALAPPLPLPEVLLPLQGCPQPDRGYSEIWPHEIAGETPQ